MADDPQKLGRPAPRSLKAEHSQFSGTLISPDHSCSVHINLQKTARCSSGNSRHCSERFFADSRAQVSSLVVAVLVQELELEQGCNAKEAATTIEFINSCLEQVAQETARPNGWRPVLSKHGFRSGCFA
jgi:hypothetical protein